MPETGHIHEHQYRPGIAGVIPPPTPPPDPEPAPADEPAPKEPARKAGSAVKKEST